MEVDRVGYEDLQANTSGTAQSGGLQKWLTPKNILISSCILVGSPIVVFGSWKLSGLGKNGDEVTAPKTDNLRQTGPTNSDGVADQKGKQHSETPPATATKKDSADGPATGTGVNNDHTTPKPNNVDPIQNQQTLEEQQALERQKALEEQQAQQKALEEQQAQQKALEAQQAQQKALEEQQALEQKTNQLQTLKEQEKQHKSLREQLDREARIDKSEKEDQAKIKKEKCDIAYNAFNEAINVFYGDPASDINYERARNAFDRAELACGDATHTVLDPRSNSMMPLKDIFAVRFNDYLYKLYTELLAEAELDPNKLGDRLKLLRALSALKASPFFDKSLSSEFGKKLKCYFSRASPQSDDIRKLCQIWNIIIGPEIVQKRVVDEFAPSDHGAEYWKCFSASDDQDFDTCKDDKIEFPLNQLLGALGKPESERKSLNSMLFRSVASNAIILTLKKKPDAMAEALLTFSKAVERFTKSGDFVDDGQVSAVNYCIQSVLEHPNPTVPVFSKRLIELYWNSSKKELYEGAYKLNRNLLHFKVFDGKESLEELYLKPLKELLRKDDTLLDSILVQKMEALINAFPEFADSKQIVANFVSEEIPLSPEVYKELILADPGTVKSYKDYMSDTTTMKPVSTQSTKNLDLTLQAFLKKKCSEASSSFDKSIRAFFRRPIKAEKKLLEGAYSHMVNFCSAADVQNAKLSKPLAEILKDAFGVALLAAKDLTNTDTVEIKPTLKKNLMAVRFFDKDFMKGESLSEILRNHHFDRLKEFLEEPEESKLDDAGLHWGRVRCFSSDQIFRENFLLPTINVLAQLPNSFGEHLLLMLKQYPNGPLGVFPFEANDKESRMSTLFQVAKSKLPNIDDAALLKKMQNKANETEFINSAVKLSDYFPTVLESLHNVDATNFQMIEEELLNRLQTLFSEFDKVDVTESFNAWLKTIELWKPLSARDDMSQEVKVKEFFKSLLQTCISNDSDEMFSAGLSSSIFILTKHPEEMQNIPGASVYLSKIIVSVKGNDSSALRDLVWKYIYNPNEPVIDSKPYVVPALKKPLEDMLKKEFDSLFTATQEPFQPFFDEDFEILNQLLDAIRFFDRSYQNNYSLDLVLYHHHEKSLLLSLLSFSEKSPSTGLVREAEYHWMRAERYGVESDLKSKFKLPDDYKKGTMSFAELLYSMIRQYMNNEDSKDVFLNDDKAMSYFQTLKKAFPEYFQLMALNANEDRLKTCIERKKRVAST